MLKAAGIIMILTSCSLLGFEFAARLKRRRENLEDIKRGIAMMEREMQFFKYPLHTVFKRAAQGMAKDSKELFSNAAEKLEKNSGDAEKVWESEIEILRTELCLSKEEAEKIKCIFSGLGKTDSLSQRKIMASALENMQIIIEECNKICDKNIKVYQGIGVLLGLFLALVLI